MSAHVAAGFHYIICSERIEENVLLTRWGLEYNLYGKDPAFTRTWKALLIDESDILLDV